ncbi:TPA: hypothetical protein ACGQUH_000866 [Serratia liquefaciens]
MTNDKKSMTSTGTTITTGAIGAILSVMVPAIFKDPNNAWRVVVYAAVPIVSIILTHGINWVICRHGLESPEDASKRAKCLRDLKTIETQLNSKPMTKGIRDMLLLEKEATIKLLISIGKESINSPPLISTEEPIAPEEK